MMIPFRRIRMDFMLAVGRSLGAAITISAVSAAASHRPTVLFSCAASIAGDTAPAVLFQNASKNAPEFGSVFHWICFYFKLSARCRNVTMWPRVQFAIVPKLPSPIPLVMPFSAAQSTGSVNHSPAGTSLNGIAVELTAG